MKMKRKDTRLMAMLLSGIAAIGLGGSIHIFYKSNEALVQIPVATTTLQVGDKITSSDISYKQIHPNAVTNKMVTNPADLVDSYVMRQTNPDEYFYMDFVATDYHKRIADRAVYSAVPVAVNQLTSVNGEIRPDDFVMISIIVGSNTKDQEFSENISTAEMPEVTIIESPQLRAVRVLDVVDSSGISTSDKKNALIDKTGKVPIEASIPQPNMLILDCNSMQRALLLQGANVGKVQVSILPEAEQEEYRKQMLGIDTTGGNNTNANKDDATLSESGLTPEEIEKRKEELGSDIKTDEYLQQQQTDMNKDMETAQKLADAELEKKLRKEAEAKGLTYEEAKAQYEQAKKNAEKTNVNNTMNEYGIKDN